MKTIVVAVTILNACFMQEVSGDPVLSSAHVDAAALKPEVKIAMTEETKVLDGVQDSLEDAVDEDDTDDEEEDGEDLADVDDTDAEGADDEDLDDADLDAEDLVDEDGTGDEDEEVNGELSLLETNAADDEDDEDDEEEQVGDDDEDDEYDDDDDEEGEVDAIDDMYEENPVVTLVAAMSESVQKLSTRSEDLLLEAQKMDATEEAKTAAEQAMKEFQDAFEKELKEKGTKFEDEVLGVETAKVFRSRPVA